MSNLLAYHILRVPQNGRHVFLHWFTKWRQAIIALEKDLVRRRIHKCYDYHQWDKMYQLSINRCIIVVEILSIKNKFRRDKYQALSHSPIYITVIVDEQFGKITGFLSDGNCKRTLSLVVKEISVSFRLQEKFHHFLVSRNHRQMKWCFFFLVGRIHVGSPS